MGNRGGWPYEEPRELSLKKPKGKLTLIAVAAGAGLSEVDRGRLERFLEKVEDAGDRLLGF